MRAFASKTIYPQISQIRIRKAGRQEKWMPKDVAAYRAMMPREKLTRALKFTERIRQFKIESVRVHHPGWTEEKVLEEVRRRSVMEMNPAELHDWWPPE
jgi:hypothetical protein